MLSLVCTAILFIACEKEKNEPNLAIATPITTSTNLPSGVTEDELLTLKMPVGVKKEQVKWDKEKAEVTFIANTNFSNLPNPDLDKEGFYWSVPASVKVVFIEKNVKVTGGFRVTGELAITGKDRTTSEIFGTDTKAWSLGPDAKTDPGTSCSAGAKGDDYVHDCEKWKYGAISSSAPNTTTLMINNLTITNARSYAITSFGPKIIVDNVYVRNTRPKPDYHSNSDGISAGTGSIVKNSKFDCWDDAIKLYRDITVENVTIVHNSNGAPFQFGWGNDNNTTNHTLKNILVEVNNADYTNLALFSASLTTGKLNRNVNIDGLKVSYAPDQKIRNQNPLPLFLMNSSEAILSIKGQNINMSAPIGQSGPGKVNIDICGSSEIKNSYQCGDFSKVNGCGW